MLDEEIEEETDMTDLQRRREFMALSLEERRKIMRQQAEEMKQHYEDTADERYEWQRGDIIEYKQQSNE